MIYNKARMPFKAPEHVPVAALRADSPWLHSVPVQA
jgi:hypothetical protein